jgi:adenylyltransferase/sulfurtransferase
MNRNEVREITVHQLKEMMDNKVDFAIIDVREPDEVEICNIGGINIPLGAIDVNVDKIPRDKMTILHCRSGKRSQMAAFFLQQEHSYENLYNLAGGIIDYAKKIDDSLTLY